MFIVSWYYFNKLQSIKYLVIVIDKNKYYCFLTFLTSQQMRRLERGDKLNKRLDLHPKHFPTVTIMHQITLFAVGIAFYRCNFLLCNERVLESYKMYNIL